MLKHDYPAVQNILESILKTPAMGTENTGNRLFWVKAQTGKHAVPLELYFISVRHLAKAG